MTVPLFFFHGLYGSPQGHKADLIKRAFPLCQIPSLPMDLPGRSVILESLITLPSLLIGSSLGGLSAILFAMKKPELVRGMLLLAPLVGLYEKERCSKDELESIYSAYIPAEIPAMIVAANGDQTIPLDEIQQFVDRCPVKKNIQLFQVDDEHGLANSDNKIVELAQALTGIIY